MDILTGLHWHGSREDGDGRERPSNRPRTSTSVIVLQAGTQLVRSPLDTISSIADSLGYTPNNRLASVSEEFKQKQICLANLQRAETWEEWEAAALELDRLEGRNEWKAHDDSDDYDYQLVNDRLRNLEDARDRRDFATMRHQVRATLTRDLGGMGNVRLYSHSRVGTKALIERYIDTVVEVIGLVVEDASGGLNRGRDTRNLWDDMKIARQSFGRSALLLSGGGTLGMNHIGVVKALFEADLLPRIISGASAGSIVCAVLCTKTDAEIPDVLHEFCHGDLDVFESSDESPIRKVTRFFTEGAIYDIINLKRVMENLIGQTTFQEAYNRTRRILNICVSSAGVYEMPRLLNYVTAPDVMIASAVAASCSVPSVFSAAELMAKDPRTGIIKPFDDSPSKWIDGSVDNDLPMMRLSEMLNVNHFIVSQVNPHVVPFLAREEDENDPEMAASSPALAPSSSWVNSMANMAKGEALHRLHVLTELGVFPNVMTKVRSVVGQRYAGDITIMPEISYAEFPKILSNPTEAFMVQAVRNGERATWPKLSRIRNHLAVELKLDWAVQKALARVAFSQSQVDLRMNVFARPIKRTISGRGRPRRQSRTSIHSAIGTTFRRSAADGQITHRPVKSMVEPASLGLSFSAKVAGSQHGDNASSGDEARSPCSTSCSPSGDGDDDSGAESDTSESPPSPGPEVWPTARFHSVSQPATPSIASKRFMSESPANSRSPTPMPTSLTMTPSPMQRPSSPESRYKRLFHGALRPMPTIRSQAGTPEPQERREGQEAEERRPALSHRRSKLAMSLGLSGNKADKPRRLSTGAPGLKPPDKR